MAILLRVATIRQTEHRHTDIYRYLHTEVQVLNHQHEHGHMTAKAEHSRWYMIASAVISSDS